MSQYITEGNAILDFSGSLILATDESFQENDISISPNLDTYAFSYVKTDPRYGHTKLYVFFSYLGHVRVFNVDGEIVSNSSPNVPDDTLAIAQSYYNLHLDLLEGANFPTVVDGKYIVHCDPVTNFLRFNILNAEAPQIDSSGNQIINCDTGEHYGNLEFLHDGAQTYLFRTNSFNRLFIGATTEELNEIFDKSFPIPNTVNNIREFSLIDMSIVAQDEGINALSPIFKYFVVPIKNAISPKDDTPIEYGVVAFDPSHNCFFFRFLSPDLVAYDQDINTLNYLHTDNGKFTTGPFSSDYNLVLRYADIDKDSDIVISSFNGFSFDGDNGLKNTASKKWNSESKLFSIGETDDSESFARMYEQLPVAFGNRLLPAFTYPLIGQSGMGDDGVNGSVFIEEPISPGPVFEDNELLRNTGFFYVAYAVKHGFILMRMHSYCPILLCPAEANGLELHIPGGKWNYQELTQGGFSTPTQDAHGFTPISMAFSPDNNFLYTIVANPEDRTEKYICIYNLSLGASDALNISNTAFMHKDPFDSGAKRVELIENKIVFFSEDGEEFLYINSPDTYISASTFSSVQISKSDNLYISGTTSIDFDITPVRTLDSVPTDSNTWTPSTQPLTLTGYATLLNTQIVDNLALTPLGPIDLLNPVIFGSESTEEWLNSATLSGPSGNPIISAKLQFIDGHPEITVFNPVTNQVYTDNDSNDIIVRLDDSKTFDNFYKDRDNLKIIKLVNPNTYAVIVKYVDENIVANPNNIMNIWYNYYTASADKENYDHINYGGACVFELQPNDNINFLFNAGVRNKLRMFTFVNYGLKPPAEYFRTAMIRSKNATKIVSLSGEDSYHISVRNFGAFQQYQSTLVTEVYVINISNTFEKEGIGELDYTSTIWNDSPSNPKFTFNLPIYFGAVGEEGSGIDITIPEYSSIAVSHDVNFFAIANYAYGIEGGFHIYLIAVPANISLKDDGSQTLSTGELKYFPAQFNNEACVYMSNILGDHYYVDQMEFSANKKNLYILLLDKREEEKLEADSTLENALPPKVLKVNLGPIHTYWNKYDEEDFVAPATHSITPSDIQWVSSYRFDENSDASLLPAEFNADLLLNQDYQSSVRIAGMFKGLNNEIYLSNKDVSTGRMAASLGKIINSNHEMHSGSNITKIIKAGISYSTGGNNNILE